MKQEKQKRKGKSETLIDGVDYDIMNFLYKNKKLTIKSYVCYSYNSGIKTQ